MNIWACGVSDQESDTGTLYITNPGMGSIVNTQEFIGAHRNVTEISDIPMIIMLDSMATELGWFDNPICIAILKIDIEGFEPPTFKGALKLLASGMVENVVMEMTSRWDNAENEQMLANFVTLGFTLYMMGQSQGLTLKDVPTTNADLPKKVLQQCGKMTRMQFNLWWSIQILHSLGVQTIGALILVLRVLIHSMQYRLGVIHLNFSCISASLTPVK